MKRFTQLFQDVSWGEVDICIVDMPPGTGDAQISLSQMLQLSGGIVVTTPQELALADVRKAMNMLAKVNVPVLGIVENMAGFVTPSGEKFDIFGAGGAQKLSEAFSVPTLASIPIVPKLREAGDQGVPAVCREDVSEELSKSFQDLALKLRDILDNQESSAEASAGVEIVN